MGVFPEIWLLALTTARLVPAAPGQTFALTGVAVVHYIRRYRDSDLNDVISAWKSASKTAHPFLTTDFLERERYNIPNVYLPNADTWVAEYDGRVIGFMRKTGYAREEIQSARR